VCSQRNQLEPFVEYAYESFMSSPLSGMTCDNVNGETKPYAEAIWDTTEKFAFNFFRFSGAKVFYVKLMELAFNLFASFPFPLDDRTPEQVEAIRVLKVFGIQTEESLMKMALLFAQDAGFKGMVGGEYCKMSFLDHHDDIYAPI